MAFYLLEPVRYVVESEFLSYVIYEYNSHSTFVVGLGDCAKSLLTCSIPDLKFNSLVQHVYSFDLEIDAWISYK